AITGYSGVLNVNINADTAGQVGSMMDALDAVIVLIVICAGLLAGIVLYNLTNINIKERIREIATIKVLGFNAAETGSYVFKENLALTALGTFLGLFAGKWLHATVMDYVRIDMVWFGYRIAWTSYLISALLTIVAALIVDTVMYFQLEKINMAEALKSVE
ncbi:MAG: ABC transporter permease, partial [Oscillospiraceae bacterium]|nr:ABC transporter permease [Oscillospiraceae bacterium]